MPRLNPLIVLTTLSVAAFACGATPVVDAESVAMWRADAARYERGDGVAKDPDFAAALYCRAARADDGESAFQLGWMYAYGRGVARNDAWAGYFFARAAARGIEQAPGMLRLVGGAPDTTVDATPDCMRPPATEARVDARAEAAAQVAVNAAITATRTTALLKAAPKAIADLVMKLAPEYRIQPSLALAIIKAESNFDTLALSPKNAMGLMQLIPETAERFAVKDAYDPKQNIRGGLAYLRWLLAYFEGDVALVAAAYNAGEGTVERYQGVPPFEETRAYVRRVIESVGLSAHPFDPKAAVASPRMRAPQRVSQRAAATAAD